MGRRQTEFPDDLFKGSVQPVPLRFWHKALRNTQEKEVRWDMKFKLFVFQMWLLWKCCGQPKFGWSGFTEPALLGLSEGLCLSPGGDPGCGPVWPKHPPHAEGAGQRRAPV